MHLFCLCRLPLIFTNININLCEKKVSCFVIIVFENCVSLTGRPISNAYLIFFRTALFYFTYLSSIDVDTLENHEHPLHIITDRNQEFIFFSLKPFHIHKRKIS